MMLLKCSITVCRLIFLQLKFQFDVMTLWVFNRSIYFYFGIAVLRYFRAPKFVSAP